MDSPLCDATNDPYGANQPYLLWVLTTDGGSATITGSQGLNLGGSGSGYFAPDKSTGNTFKFVTPYFTPDSSLTAVADFTVVTAGGGSWNLVISHGCAPNLLTPDVSTTIVLDSNGQPVSGTPPTVAKGTAVHDTATVTGTGPTPTGTVTFTLHDGSDCTGSTIATSTGALDGSGVASSSSFTPLTAGDFSYSAHYNGDLNYKPADAAACEPLHVRANNAGDLTVSKSADTSFTRTFKWTIDKSADPTTVYSAGGGESGKTTWTVSVTKDAGTDSDFVVSGQIDVINPTPDAIDLSGVTDSLTGAIVSCPVSFPYTLAAGDTLTCTYSASVADASGGTNTATALGTDSTSASGSADYTFSDPTNVVNDSINVTDTNGVSTPFSDSGSVSYDQTFTDPAGTCTDHTNTATITETGDSSSATVKDCQGADLTVSKDATPSFTRTYKWDISKSADPAKVFTAGGADGTSKYAVFVFHNDGTDSGWKVTGKITVSNPNDWESVTLTGVTDAIDNGGDCSITSGDVNGTIAAGDSATFDYVCTYTSAPTPADFTNTATATWDAAAAHTLNGSADGTATGAFGKPTTIVDGSVDVTDSVAGHLGTVDYTVTSPYEFSYDGVVSGPAGKCTPNDNTATFTTSDTGATGSASATVIDCQGADLKVSKTANPTFTRTFKWGIDKSVDNANVKTAGGAPHTFNYAVNVNHDAGTDSDWALTGTITITNPNAWEPITLTSLDDSFPGGTCTVDPGPYEVPASGSLDVNYSCTSDGSGTKNTATATWDSAAYHTPSGSASGEAAVAFDKPTTIVDGIVSVSDSMGGSLGTVSYTDPSPTTFTYSKTFTDPAGTCTSHDNTATFTTNTTGTTDSASQTVTDCQGADLTVSKTATPSFTRAYKWGITKNVDKTLVKLIGGGSATFNYTVTASHDSGTDSAWGVTGTITVTNPNDWEDISLTSLSDALNSSGACTLGIAGPYVVPASSSIQVDYTCATANANDTKNTATATWDSAAYSTPNGSASGDAAFDFTTPTTLVDDCVTLTDTFNGGSPVTLGKACVGGGWTKAAGNNLASFSESYSAPTFTFKYSRTISAPPAGTCVVYPNTAEFTTNTTGSKDHASQSVTVCNYNAALTPGYWKNHLNLAKFPQSLGNYAVNTQAKATAIYNAMNCSSTTAQDAIGCLAGHLLSTEFNLANKSDPCIAPVVAKANDFLKGLVVDGVTGIIYIGPTGTYSLTSAQRAEAITLKTALDKYNNGLGC